MSPNNEDLVLNSDLERTVHQVEIPSQRVYPDADTWCLGIIIVVNEDEANEAAGEGQAVEKGSAQVGDAASTAISGSW